ncbi:hypothetical protein H311_04035 [Anncaliia algerae PRA109]|uniref:DBF4-type domain-containing protein n=1 Tax=Anncaliia algerae PRA339 TaxID=1288291 RepID=A0A059F5D3_9MICR|nr:hypothetical protein H311_04035 [Anncaliia algerae PRA109]KCZ82317.1 hypothetical protein H312_00340 [Anncaliia algerae PRA339]
MKKYIIFKNPYILIEDIRKKYRPYFKEYLKEKPTLNLRSYPMNCPFVPGIIKHEKKNKVKQGVCETCYEKFSNYFEHIKSKEHRDFAVDDRHYIELDMFISQFNTKSILQTSTFSDNSVDGSCLTSLLPDVDSFIHEYLNKK